jgi:hypothetical protein
MYSNKERYRQHNISKKFWLLADFMQFIIVVRINMHIQRFMHIQR